MEKFMKNICNGTDKDAYNALLIARLFWLIFDTMNKTNRADIFEYLYITPKRRRDTYLNTNTIFNVNLRTLERYRKAFVNSFEAAFSLLKNKIITLEIFSHYPNHNFLY